MPNSPTPQSARLWQFYSKATPSDLRDGDHTSRPEDPTLEISNQTCNPSQTITRLVSIGGLVHIPTGTKIELSSTAKHGYKTEDEWLKEIIRFNVHVCKPVRFIKH